MARWQQVPWLVAGLGDGERALTANRTFSAEHGARSLVSISVGEEDGPVEYIDLLLGQGPWSELVEKWGGCACASWRVA